MSLVTIQASQVQAIPDWAHQQRHLMAVMNEAAPLFQERYTRPDGTLPKQKERFTNGNPTQNKSD